jgi:hypothetical protein
MQEGRCRKEDEGGKVKDRRKEDEGMNTKENKGRKERR